MPTTVWFWLYITTSIWSAPTTSSLSIWTTYIVPSFGGYTTTPQHTFGYQQQQQHPQFTDLSSVFSAMSLQQLPQDPNHYMDTGASSHMQFNSGNLIYVTPCDKSKSIMVGNGDVLPVQFVGQSYFPFSQNRLLLNNILVSNQLIKNSISVRRFIIDNSVSGCFDPFVLLAAKYMTSCGEATSLILLLDRTRCMLLAWSIGTFIMSNITI